MTDPAEIFLQEAAELLDQLEQALLDLEGTPSNRALIDAAFRALHTIKGSGAMFGFEEVSAFTHGFETAFDRVRKGLTAPSSELVAVALLAKDHIRTLIESPAAADRNHGTAILQALQLVVEVEAATESAPSQSVPEMAGQEPAEPSLPLKTWRLQLRFNDRVLVNGTNPLLLLDELRGLGECTVVASTDAVPDLSRLDPEVCYLTWDVTLITAEPRAMIEDVFIFVVDEMDLVIECLDDEPPLLNEPALLEASPAPPKAAAAPAAASTAPAVSGAAADRIPPSSPDKSASDGPVTGRKDATVRVPAERVDELMDRVGELVIAQARLSQLSQQLGDINVKSIAEEIERLAAGLRDITMGIRMVPIGALFGRFRRLAYDLSRELGKPVELTSIGEETELDKTMIDQLADPLVHLIRNAVDHGLENPAARATAGKPASGQIKLIARHSGAEVLISVSDDGRGLDTARIRAKAEGLGLIAPGAEMSDPEIQEFIFHPGFSTNQEVTALSGRGVGMDVVKRNIEALRGKIDLHSTPGQGTEITLRLPLTLAIIDGLLVRVGGARYVIPLSAVEECVELSSAEDTRSKGRSFMRIRGELVPFLRLRELFTAKTPADLHQKAVVVAAGDLRVGLVVDQIIGSHQTVIKTLSKLHADAVSFSGATILGDGTVALILDIPHLVDFGRSHEARGRSHDKSQKMEAA